MTLAAVYGMVLNGGISFERRVTLVRGNFYTRTGERETVKRKGRSFVLNSISFAIAIYRIFSGFILPAERIIITKDGGVKGATRKKGGGENERKGGRGN